MKILWHSNAPWACTGYGQQTGLCVPRLQAAGHEVAISAFYGLHGGVLNWGPHPVYPGGSDPYGNDVVTAHAAHWFGGTPRDGLVITLVDAWVLNVRNLSRANVASWVPVDHEPVPARVVEALKGFGPHVLAMSRFGEAQLREAGLDPIYVPHGIDTTVMEPTSRKEAREAIGLDVPDDCYVVGMVAANKGKPSRKALAEAVAAYRLARDELAPRPCMLYVHTEMTGMVDGIDMLPLLAALELTSKEVLFADQYQLAIGLSPQYMANVYNAMDVLLNPAMGEGFGIPIVEAQACGTQVIVGDNTAQRELVGFGEKVPGQRFWTYQESYQYVPDYHAAAAALVRASRWGDNVRDPCRDFALQYDADVVMKDYWLPALERIEASSTTATDELPAVETFDLNDLEAEKVRADAAANPPAAVRPA